MKKLVQIACSLSLLFLMWLPATLAQAQATRTQTDNNILKSLGSAAERGFGAPADGKTSITPGQVIGQVINVALGFIGTITFIIFLYGGFMWLSARGNEDQVKTAKSYLRNGVIGTIIVIMAYSLTYFLTDIVFKATG